MNMEVLGHSHNAESKSPPSPHRIILKCGHPYSSSSSENIDFTVEPGVCVDRWCYNLDSDFHGAHIVSKHNPEKCFVLTHKKYKITLDRWLEENSNNWCPTYEKLGVSRPKDEARQIIRGILRAVYELHSDGSFHGFLYNSENFAIQYDESVIGGYQEKIKQVFLIHKNCQLMGVRPTNEIKGKKEDMSAVSDVIFKHIIKGQRCPKDLQELRKLLKKDESPWKLIVNHPSLWHWKSRFTYPALVWMEYLQAKQSTQRSMDGKFRNIQLGDWRNSVPKNGSLEKVLYYKPVPPTPSNQGQSSSPPPPPKPSYESSTKELLRYLRNVRVHYKNRGHGDLDQQSIEHETTKVSEVFLVELYYKMCELEIDI